MRRPTRIAWLALLAATAAGAATSVTWASFEPAFPPFPCPDGWSSCIVEGAVLAPGTVKDLAGRPHAADMRVGFFDFDPLPALSPFESLSPYDGHRQVLRPADHPIAGQTAAAPRTPPPVVATTPKSAPKITEPEHGSTQPVAMVEPTAPPARPMAEPVVAEVEAPKPPPSESGGDCNDLVALESQATMGQLSPETRSCLEGRAQSAPQPTTRGKASRLLLSDAEARGDKTEWQRLMKRHLEDIDRSDPNLCLKYAMFLSRGGDAWGVIRWSNYALENKQTWSGPTYTKYVYQLHRLRAQAATRLWQESEKEFVASRAQDVEAEAAKRRGVAKDYALEWLDYARESGQDATDASNLCVSAAGSAAFCE